MASEILIVITVVLIERSPGESSLAAGERMYELVKVVLVLLITIRTRLCICFSAPLSLV